MQLECPFYVTDTETAEMLSVSVERIDLWVRECRLPVDARARPVGFLFRRETVETIGAELATLTAPHLRFRGRRRDRRTGAAILLPSVPALDCGCQPSRVSIGLGRTGTSLAAALALAEMLATEAPNDPFLARLATVTHEALATRTGDPDAARRAGAEALLVALDCDAAAVQAGRATGARVPVNFPSSAKRRERNRDGAGDRIVELIFAGGRP